MLPVLDICKVLAVHGSARVPRSATGAIGMYANDTVVTVAHSRARHSAVGIALVIELPASARVPPIIALASVPDRAIGLVAGVSCNAVLRFGEGGARLLRHSQIAHVSSNVRIESAAAALDGEDCNVILPASAVYPG